MGSYLTITNNTPDTWQCKVGPDMAALKISSIVVGIVGAAMAALAITGAALALVSLTILPIATLGAGVLLPVNLALSSAGALYLAQIGSTLTASISLGATVIALLPVAALVQIASVAATGVGAGATAAAVGAVGASVAVVAGGAGVTPFGIAIVNAVKEMLKIKGYDTIPPGQSYRYGRMSLSLWQQSVCRRTITTGPHVVVETVIMRPIFSGSTTNSNRAYDIQDWINKHGITSKHGIEGRSRNETRKLTQDNDHIEHYQFYANGSAFNTETGARYQETSVTNQL